MKEFDYTFAPEAEYGGQWFDDFGATLLALGEPGLAWDLTHATNMPREQLNQIVYRLGASRVTEGGLTD